MSSPPSSKLGIGEQRLDLRADCSVELICEGLTLKLGERLSDYRGKNAVDV